MELFGKACFIYCILYLIDLIVRAIIHTYRQHKGIKDKHWYKFNLADVDSNDLEFAVLAENFEEAINIVRDNISVKTDKYWIEFPSVDFKGDILK